MNYPLRRSVLFWLGLFGTVSILWAWSDSQSHITTLSIPAKNERNISSAVGYLGSMSVDGAEPSDWAFERSETFAGLWFQKPQISRTSRSDGLSGETLASTEILIPYWLILLPYLAAWLLLLSLRVRKYRSIRG